MATLPVGSCMLSMAFDDVMLVLASELLGLAMGGVGPDRLTAPV